MSIPPTADKGHEHPWKSPWRFFREVLRTRQLILLLVLILILIAAGLGQASSYLFKLIVDAVEIGESKTAIGWALLYPLVVLVIQLAYRGSGFFGAIVATEACHRARSLLSEYLLRHDHTYFSNRLSGSLANKVKNVESAIGSLLPDIFWNLFDAIVTYVVTIILIMLVDVRSGLFFIGLLVVLVLINTYLGKTKVKLSHRSAAAGSRYQGFLIDAVSNITAVRQYTRTLHEQERIVSASAEKRDTGRKSWFYSEYILFINGLVLFFVTILMFWSLTDKWSQGLVSTGDFVLVLALYVQLTGSLVFMGQMFSRMSQSLGEMREGLDEIFVPYTVIDKSQAASLSYSGGSIEWREVSFCFGENTVFDNFSLTIPAGQRVGLVGTSGAGKSTFVSLMLRQYDVLKGHIFIDGQDISTVTQDSLRAAIAVVPQEPMLFHRTIKENILYGQPLATEDDLFAAARRARVHDFVRLLPDGYETLVGERGVKLSGGQKQRVAIARALLKDAPILILDEATSALDSESEVAIQKALHALMAGKTVIAIAHRLSTLREMDRIIVLENGVVIEDGAHDALVAYEGIYAKLWQHQSGGFLV